MKGDRTTEEGLWWSNMRTRLNRNAFTNDVYGPDKIDHSPNEIFLSHVVHLMEGLSKANTPESAERKLAIMTLWRMAGRAGEPAFLSYEGFQWNALHQTACIECPQTKSSKLKFVPFVAGSGRHKDWLLAFADDLVLKRGETIYDSTQKTWLLPCLQECSNPNLNPSPSPNPNPNPDPDSNQGGTQGAGASTKLSNFIKAMQPAGRSGAQQKYSGVSVSVLPPAPTAAGVRHGAADMLCQSMPAELAVHTTGHDLTGISALWEYLNARISLCIPGSVILAGWPAFAYGQTGQGPVR